MSHIVDLCPLLSADQDRGSDCSNYECDMRQIVYNIRGTRYVPRGTNSPHSSR